MAAGWRFEFLMETDQYEQLRALARRRKTSVGELIRRAVRQFDLSRQHIENRWSTRSSI